MSLAGFRVLGFVGRTLWHQLTLLTHHAHTLATEARLATSSTPGLCLLSAEETDRVNFGV